MVNVSQVNGSQVNGVGGAAPVADPAEALAEVLSTQDLQELEHLIVELLATAFSTSDDTELFEWLPLSEEFTLIDAIEHVAAAQKEIEESLEIADVAAILFEWLGQEDLEITPVLLTVTAIQLAETLIAAGVIEKQLEAINAIAVALAIQDVVQIGSFEEIAEVVQLAATYVMDLQAVFRSVESLQVSDTTVLLIVSSIELAENVELSTSTELSQVLTQLLADGIGIEAILALGDAVYAAWTLNPDTQGVTRYTDFPYNSLAYPYAAKDDGIYLLEGTSPTASIKTGLFDFGTSRKKRIPEIFIGVSDADGVVLKVITTNNTVRQEHWYQLQKAAATDDVTRVKLGKGLKSVYWQFELVSEEFLDLDTFEFHPFELSRRL